MIRSFRNRALKRFFEKGDPRRLSVPDTRKVHRMLIAIETARRPEQLNLPGWKWHPLMSQARWSIWVTGNWRITFGWEDGNAIAVDLEDYH